MFNLLSLVARTPVAYSMVAASAASAIAGFWAGDRWQSVDTREAELATARVQAECKQSASDAAIASSQLLREELAAQAGRATQQRKRDAAAATAARDQYVVALKTRLEVMRHKSTPVATNESWTPSIRLRINDIAGSVNSPADRGREGLRGSAALQDILRPDAYGGQLRMP